MKRLIFIFLMIGTISCNQPKQNNFSGLVTESTGDSYVNSSVAKIGQLLTKNDLIKTENGTVTLQLKNGSAIRLRQFTTVTFSNLEEVSLPHGQILVSVKKLDNQTDFRINTPTAVAGVRGTMFSVTSVDNGTEVSVLEGAVEVNQKITRPNEKALALKDKTVIIGTTFNSNEVFDLKSLPTMTPEEVDNIANKSETAQNFSDNMIKFSESQKTVATQEAFKSIENRRDYIATNSNLVETINLRNGRTIVGYIVGQTKDIIVMWNANGKKFEQINKSQIDSQEIR